MCLRCLDCLFCLFRGRGCYKWQRSLIRIGQTEFEIFCSSIYLKSKILELIRCESSFLSYFRLISLVKKKLFCKLFVAIAYSKKYLYTYFKNYFFYTFTWKNKPNEKLPLLASKNSICFQFRLSALYFSWKLPASSCEFPHHWKKMKKYLPRRKSLQKKSFIRNLDFIISTGNVPEVKQISFCF